MGKYTLMTWFPFDHVAYKILMQKTLKIVTVMKAARTKTTVIPKAKVAMIVIQIEIVIMIQKRRMSKVNERVTIHRMVLHGRRVSPIKLSNRFLNAKDPLLIYKSSFMVLTV